MSVWVLVYERLRITYSSHRSVGIFAGTTVRPLFPQFTSFPSQNNDLIQVHLLGHAPVPWLYSTKVTTDTHTINHAMIVCG
jgi:hypothetical protein